MSDIYEQHKAAFNSVAAYVIMRGDDKVATVAIKFPRDGAGRLYAYVHWLGLEMVRGFAGGGGYDKRSAACANAARKITNISALTLKRQDEALKFRDALAKDSSGSWDGDLRAAGFTVYQAV